MRPQRNPPMCSNQATPPPVLVTSPNDTAPLKSWTAWLFYEPYAAGQNITGGLIEYCIFVNPHKDGWYMISAVDSGVNTTRNLVVRNNLIQPGKGGKAFYPTPSFPQYSEVHDNFNFVTGARILEIRERTP